MSSTRSTLGRAGPLIAARLISATFSLSIPLVLARTMGLAEYGTYKQLFLVFMTVVAVLPFGVAQSLYFFIPRASDRRVYVGQTLLFLAAAGAIGGAAVWLAGPLVARGLSNPALFAYRTELALYIALHVSASPLEVSMTCRGDTRGAALTYLASDFLKALVLVLPTLAGLGLHTMMWGMVGLAALRCAAAWTVLGRDEGRLCDRAAFREQLAYALPFGAAILFSIPQQYAHQFIVSHAMGPALFAIYAVGCFELPFVDLFYTPTGEVLMVHLGELERANRLEEGAAAFREAVGKLAALLLPPIAFLWAVAPTFIPTVFGARFEASVPIFRTALFVLPLAVFPIDAALRARGETRHILVSYVLKAAVTIPLAWWGVGRFGLVGAVASYLAAEVLGRGFLALRVPRALSTPSIRRRVRDLVPGRQLARTGALAVGLALLGAAALAAAQRAFPVSGGGHPIVARLLPLGLACAVFGLGYLASLAASSAQLPAILGFLERFRRRPRPERRTLTPAPQAGGAPPIV